ncbi:MAG TPA: protein kinase [Pyrinomonadaceae bacterium]|nr:protein kinase [Pyrinomonadaceae bacterium]
MSQEPEVNSTLSHYRIVSKLGAGGMGEVYLAQDTKLDRKVALKILPADLASNRERMERFIREAKSAAALNHPNIAHIYEIGEHDGVKFIAMEFIDGVTLREKIHRERTELTRLLRYLQHSAEGLAKAHAAGIVHRDLKPDNIMITREGHAKILDFGLAKLIELQPVPTGDSSEVATAVMPQHSSPGTVMGTVGYMSPEQAQGKTKEIDQRSDIFSFGCILFEVVTGHKAFEGKDAIDSLNKIIREPAPSLSDFNPSAPVELQRIVRRCLAKDPDERFQTIKEVAIELKELRRELEGAGIDTTVSPAVRSEATGASGAEATRAESVSPSTSTPSPSFQTRASSAEYVVSGIKRHKLEVSIGFLVLVVGGVGLGLYLRAAKSEVPLDSIAVLPFQNKSSDADTDYLSDGLAESLIYRLSQLPNLKVSPTSSVFRYKGKETDPQKIGNELGVSAVMSGRIVQRGDNLTISVELVGVRNNTLLWGEQYDRKMSDLLATQREIATTITQKLQLKLGSGDTTGITKRYTDSNDAYQLYLKGRFHFAKRTKDDIQRGIDYFQQAIKLDPNFALAYARIAESYVSMPAYPYLSPKEAVPQAKAAAKRALEIDPTLAEAHTFLAYAFAIFDWDWAEAEREFKRGIELDPNNSPAHFRYGQIYLAAQGRSDEAIAEVKQALEIEPLDLNMGGNLSWVYFSARQYDRALEQGKKTYELDTNFVTARWNVSSAYIGKGMYAEAIAINEKALQTDPTSQFALHSVGYAYAKSGRRHEAKEVIKRFKEIAKSQYTVSYWIATIYAALDDKDKAFAELENSFAEHDFYLHRLKVDPFWDPLRQDPRFREMLKRLNLPE